MRKCVTKAMLAAIFVTGILTVNASASEYPVADTTKSLITRFTFTATLDSGTINEPLDIWLPLPSNSNWQTITDVRIDAPAAYRITMEKKYQDRMVYVHIDHPIFPAAVSASFTVYRSEPRVLDSGYQQPNSNFPSITAADSLVPTGGKYFDLAKAIVASDSASIAQEHALFDNVLSTMTYDYKKISPRYAMGDSAFVCDYKSGNCSDLHSYLISLSRSIDIPAVLEFGFPLTGIAIPPRIPTDGNITGYHCWIWFKAGNEWIPEDAADARRWQDIGRSDVRDYLFGNLLLPRSAVAVSRGRDIVLSPPQKGAPLNYFIYPYAESDGIPIHANWVVSYHIIKSM